MKIKTLRYVSVLCLLFLSAGCGTISTFDQLAYVQVTNVKVDVLGLMDKSVEPYASHEKEVEAVNAQLFKAVEYERHRAKNTFTTKMWDRLYKVDSTGEVDAKSIIASYWVKWKKDGKEKEVFVTEAKIQVAEGFDLIAELESKKLKPTDSKITTFLKNQ